ncbi:hypothetical protein G3T14_22780 [Methylobacterium sp. BTF04]|uniref:hypothetical protein n=1 Tax=Methylobacterium sp. BTF04 TaxID=2708300 RepID=UPI0013D3C9CA|nr:hypothetical protein [Methylobacterium sp. BTF04]NEU14885.1 hypothetical protein [Methylobacterium sp. BTF04]
MDDREHLEARIIALEYALEVLTDCLSDRNLIDPAKIARLFQTAADAPEAGRANPSVPRALTNFAKRL